MQTFLAAILAMGVSGSLWAQQAPEPAGRFFGPREPAGRFFGPMVNGWPAPSVPVKRWPATIAFARLPVPAAAFPQPGPKVCSVPLLEVPVSKDVDAAMKQVRPNWENLAPIPQAKVPAPACESPSTR